MKIQDQIQAAERAISEKNADEAGQLIAALQERRLNAAQKERVAELIELFKELGGSYTMSQHLAKYRERYHRSVAASGAKSLNNGDELAQYLEMKTAKQVCELADEFTPIGDGQSHWERYQRLNEGQRRMNSGNKLRAAIKQGKVTVTDEGLRAV